MGGRYSGRWQSYNAKTLVEDCLALSVSDLVKNGLQCDKKGVGTIRWNGLNARFAFLDNVIILTYRRAGNHLCIHIGIDVTLPRYGGLRYWLLCPDCKRRCAKVYLPDEALRFACRVCHDLRYTSTRKPALAEQRRIARLIRYSRF